MGKALRGLRSRLRPLLALACSAIVLATLVVAWRQPGFAEVPPAPDDRSVWVVNDSRLLVGRINTGIGELDSAAVLRGATEVLQDPTEPENVGHRASCAAGPQTSDRETGSGAYKG